ncbi:MAG: diguanylate cyclase, partial [Lachnospiraceae bacterium]|nr:diguanylate cyclase [Lachnospiraceae bacterium]
FSINEVEVHINISLGIASYPENCDTIDNLTNSADMAMYVSKKNGRGRITIYEKSMQKESELQKEN